MYDISCFILSPCNLFLHVQSCHDVTWPVTLSIVSHMVFCGILSPNQRFCLIHTHSLSLSLSLASVLPRTVSSRRSCHEMTLYPTLFSRCVVAFHKSDLVTTATMGGLLPSKKLDPILLPQAATMEADGSCWKLFAFCFALELPSQEIPGTCC